MPLYTYIIKMWEHFFLKKKYRRTYYKQYTIINCRKYVNLICSIIKLKFHKIFWMSQAESHIIFDTRLTFYRYPSLHYRRSSAGLEHQNVLNAVPALPQCASHLKWNWEHKISLKKLYHANASASSFQMNK